MIVMRLDLSLKDESDTQTGKSIVERELNLKMSEDSEKASN